MNETTMNRYEIGHRVGKNIFYTGYTLNAIDKHDALMQYLKLSGEDDSNDIMINLLE